MGNEANTWRKTASTPVPSFACADCMEKNGERSGPYPCALVCVLIGFPIWGSRGLGV